MCEDDQTSYLFDVEQSLTVGNRTVTVYRTEITKSGFDRFELIAEVARDIDFVNELFVNPTSVSGTLVKCRCEGIEATAELSIFTRDENVLAPDKHVLHFVCSNIHTDGSAGNRFRFLLPNVHFGSADFFTVVENPDGSRTMSRDHLKFSIEERVWTLRHLIEFEKVFYTADEAIAAQKSAGVSKLHLEPSGHAVVEVNCDGLERERAMQIVEDVCWLLHLALGQRVAWSELHVVTGSKSQFVCRRAASLPEKPSGSNPIRNWCDGALSGYIEHSWPVFQKDPQWWRVSLNWFSIAAENSALESSSMIYCMLFDRLSSHLLDGYQFPKQISKELATNLEDEEKRKELACRLGELLEEYAGKEKWNPERSISLVQQIEHWNNAPSYPKKVGKAFANVGLKAPPGKLLNRRHKLMHEGGLKLDPPEALEFLCDLHQSIVALMLSMLGYRGKFFSLGRGECQMADLMLEKDEPTDSELNPDPEPKSKPSSGCLGLFLLF